MSIMENTIENKAIFFAQYWGQEVLMDVTNGGKLTSYVIEPSNMYRIEESHLELKPLSQLTDEDAIELAQIVSGNRFKYPVNKGMKEFWNYVEDMDSELELRIQLQPTKLVPANTFNLVRVLSHSVYNDFGNISDGVDHLRKKGYALPYNGLSVEKQLEYGWVKLKNITDES